MSKKTGEDETSENKKTSEDKKTDEVETRELEDFVEKLPDDVLSKGEVEGAVSPEERVERGAEAELSEITARVEAEAREIEKQNGSSSSQSLFKNKVFVISALMLVVAVALAGYAFINLGAGPSSAGESLSLQASEPDTAGVSDADLIAPFINDVDPFKGGENARVTIVEYSDFKCSFCKRSASVLSDLVKEYGDDVKVVYRDFPLDTSCNSYLRTQVHPGACKAAMAAECANEQGSFWGYHNSLFNGDGASDGEALVQFAKDNDLNVAQFSSCLESEKYLGAVKADISDAVSKSITGTPTFLVNGRLLVGHRSAEEFKTIVDSVLNAS